VTLPGCSVGVLTAKLAARVNHLVASDIADTAVARARERCRGLAHIQIHQHDVEKDCSCRSKTSREKSCDSIPRYRHPKKRRNSRGFIVDFGSVAGRQLIKPLPTISQFLFKRLSGVCHGSMQCLQPVMSRIFLASRFDSSKVPN
jgi:Methyltransferase domain